MKLLEQFIQEKIRGFKVHLTENIVDDISQFVGKRPRYFMSFRELPNLKIQTRTVWRTPVGIFSYPVDEEFNAVKRNMVRFAGEAPYTIVFQANPNANVVEGTEYTEAMLREDKKKFKEVAASYNMKNFSVDDLDYYMEKWEDDALIQDAFGRFWNIGRNISLLTTSKNLDRSWSRTPQVQWNVILRAIGYHGFTDVTGKGYIHRNEPFQGFFLTEKGINLKSVRVFRNIR